MTHKDPILSENYLVVYLDILGFSEFVLHDSANDRSIRNSIAVLEKLKDFSYRIRKSMQHLSVYAYEEKEIKQEVIESFQKNIKYHLLSDSVVISIPYHEEQFDARLYFLCQFLCDLQVEMFRLKLPVRGLEKWKQIITI